jgi:ABC-type cobalt transport system substrate-binding protein
MAKKSFRMHLDFKKLLLIAAVLVVVWVVFTSLKKEGFAGLKEGAENAMQNVKDMIEKINSDTPTSSKKSN